MRSMLGWRVTVLDDALPLSATDLFMRAVVRWQVTMSPESLIALARAEGLPLCPVVTQLGLADDPAWAVVVDDEHSGHEKRAITTAAVEAAVGGLAPALAVGTPPWRVSATPALELLVPGWALTEVVARLEAGRFVAAPTGPGSKSILVGRLADGVIDVVRLNQAARFLVSGPVVRARLGQACSEALFRHLLVTTGRAGRARLADLADLLMLAGSSPRPTTPEEDAGRDALVALAQELEVALPFPAGSADARRGASGHRGSGSGNRDARRTGRQMYDRSPPGLLSSPPPSAVDARSADIRLGIRGSGPYPLMDTLVQDLAQLGIQAVAETIGPGGIKKRRGSEAVLELLVRSAGDLAPLDLSAWLGREPDVIIDDTDGAGRDHTLRAVILKLAPAKREQPQSGAWRVLLPSARAGLVLLIDLPGVMADALHDSYPQAVCLARRLSDLSSPGVVWDGLRLPLRPVLADLVVTDARAGTSVNALTSPGLITAGAEAVLVASRRPYTYALYPEPETLRLITRPGWPVEVSGRRLTRLGHAVATTPAWRLLPRSGLRVVEGTSLSPSTIHQVLLDLGQTIGAEVRLEALLVSRGVPQVILRVWAGRQRLGVRVALSASTIRRLEAHRQALATMQGRAFPFLSPTVLAMGGHDDIQWLAETWVSGLAESGGRAWGPRGRGWAAARSVAVAVARECPTGMSGRGWALSWTERVGDAICGADQLVATMGILEEEPVPIAWCHGDLWPGNILLGRRTVGVVDWECARSDSPVGLDLMNVETFRLAHTRRWSFGWAAAWLARGGASTLDQEPALGWTSLSPRHRRALVAAMVAHHLIRDSRSDGTRHWAEANLSPFLATLPS